MVPTAKEISFSTGVLFIHVFLFQVGFFKGSIFQRDFIKSKDISRTQKFICPGFLGHVGTSIICKDAWFFYSLIFVCTSSKLSSTFNPNHQMYG